MENKQKNITLNISEGFSLELKINEKRNGYSFRCPDGIIGREYYKFCREVEKLLEQQHPHILYEINRNISLGI
jgi:hypothetical protein